MEENVLYCYCLSYEKEQYMLFCQECKKDFHLGCLKTGRPSKLMGDTYFKFLCENCSPTSQECIERIKLQWIQVLILTIYNLQLEGGGKCGYFRWREHICSFIDRNWGIFFGEKKRSSTWQGTVAGTLSAGCPSHFKSGSEDLKEPGWWALKVPTGPEQYRLAPAKINAQRGKKRKAIIEAKQTITGGPEPRLRSTKSAIQAAIELKEKRSLIMETKAIRRAKSKPHVQTKAVNRYFVPDKIEPLLQSNQIVHLAATEKCRLTHVDDHLITVIKSEPPDTIFSDCSNVSLDFNIKTEDHLFEEQISNDSNSNVFTSSNDNWDIGNEEEIDIDVTSHSSIDFTRDTELDVPFLVSQVFPEVENKETIENDLKDASSNHNSPNDQETEVGLESPQDIQPQYKLMSEYQEIQLLCRLEKVSHLLSKNIEAKRLFRKLVVRQEQRDQNRKVFNLDEEYRRLKGLDLSENLEEINTSRSKLIASTVSSDLDRFQVVCPSIQGRTHITFVTRLLGFEDNQLESIISPYTMRTLKPFIFRDYESIPLRLKLLSEIQAYPFRNSTACIQPLRHPIDYCYVKPHHIPVVNSLCREFFWPGIDLSECLQYPDFSCIVMYRKVIIGFAFMVPDVKHNEAYISFLFTLPGWRNAGLATFMIYHLIQTCMGKDVTLHVSITNPAIFLYHKFGFKVEEVCLNFYDKYLPIKSKECRHAQFLRLSR